MSKILDRVRMRFDRAADQLQRAELLDQQLQKLSGGLGVSVILHPNGVSGEIVTHHTQPVAIALPKPLARELHRLVRAEVERNSARLTDELERLARTTDLELPSS